MYMYNFKSSCHSISMHVLLFAIIVIVMAVICGGWSLSSSSWPSCFASCCSCCSSYSSCSSGSSSSSSSSSTQHILKITVPASFQSICGFHPSNPKVSSQHKDSQNDYFHASKNKPAVPSVFTPSNSNPARKGPKKLKKSWSSCTTWT